MDTNEESGSTIMGTNQESESCNLCRRNFQNKTLLESHHVKHHYIRKCPNCYKTFRQTKKYLKHLRTHINNCPYECKICLKSFNTKVYLRGHMVEHKNPEKKICKICSEVCYNHFGLMRHMLTHGRRPYECTMCDSIFSNVADRAIHIKNHVIRCGLCKNSLESEDALIDHIKKFHRKKNKSNAPGPKKRPMEVPDIIIRAECDSSDSMAESSLSDEDSDSSVSNEEKNADIVSVYNAKHKDYFICFICLQLCPTPEWLKYHMEAHTWFPCPHCPKFFFCYKDLDKHKMKNHSHQCTKCGAVFGCESDLNLHEQKCNLDSNLNSELKEKLSQVVSDAISKEDNIENELNRTLKEMEKTIGGDCKISYTIRKLSNNEDLFTPNDALCHSQEKLFNKIGDDDTACVNHDNEISILQILDLLKASESIKFPLEPFMLKRIINLEKIVEDSLNNPSSKVSEDLKKYLQEVHYYLSNISNRKLSVIYDKWSKKSS